MRKDFEKIMLAIHNASIKKLAIYTILWAFLPIIIISIIYPQDPEYSVYDCNEEKDQVVEKILECKKREIEYENKQKEIVSNYYKKNNTSTIDHIKMILLSKTNRDISDIELSLLSKDILGYQRTPDCIDLIQRSMCKIAE